jgi:hypothetical protein
MNDKRVSKRMSMRFFPSPGYIDDMSEDDSDASTEERSRRAGNRRQQPENPAGEDRRQGDRRTMKPGMRALLEALLGNR